ncbi:MAG: DUF1761 domain-containing protein [Ignavibacteria bacterium]
MKKLKINHVAVWILVIVHQAIGAGWYSPVAFAGQWTELMGKSMSDFENAGFTPFIFSIINAIIMVYSMAWLFKKLNVENFISGMRYAFVFWLAFLFVELATFNSFEMRPFGLTLIDSGKSLVTFMVSGFALGLWKKYDVIPETNSL